MTPRQEIAALIRLAAIAAAERDVYMRASGRQASRIIALEIELARLRRVASDALALVDEADPMRASSVSSPGDGLRETLETGGARSSGETHNA